MGVEQGEHRAAGAGARWRAVATLVAAALVVPLVLVTSAGPAGADRPRVTVIGDSTLLGMRADGAALISAHHDLNLQAASCRRLIEVSCDIPFRPINTIDVMHAQDGRLGRAVVIMAGYDDTDVADGIDTIVAEARRQGVEKVVWLTYMEDVSYTGLQGQTYAQVFRQHNIDLRAKAAAEPMLVVADWNDHARSHPEWFASDGIHLSGAGSPALGAFIAASLDDIPISRCAAKATGGVATGPLPPSVPDGGAVTFHPVAPIRVLDTRTTSLTLGAGNRYTVDVSATVPPTATAVAATVTAVDTCGSGYVTAHPCDGGLPLASNLNPTTDAIVAGHVVAPLSPGSSSFCITSSVQTDLVVDLSGWYGPGGDGLVPAVPRRLLDTRTLGRRAAAGEGLLVTTSAAAGHTAVLNLTSTGASGPGFLTVYPSPDGASCDPSARPLASNLNTTAGATLADLVQVVVGRSGTVCVFTSVATDIVVDETGVYAAAGGSPAHAVVPTRLVDTREGVGAPVGAGDTLAVPVPQVGARAAALNVTAVGALGPGFVTAFPAGADGSCATTRPLASILNYADATPVPNLTVTAVGGHATVCLFTMTTTHLVVDQTAWFG